jgi:hypothetical protein
MATVLVDFARILKPSRNDQRTKKGMISWFDRHLARIEHILPEMEAFDWHDQEEIDERTITEENCNGES